MPTSRAAEFPTVPFSRPYRTAALRRDAETAFRIAAEPEERAALARYLDVDRIDRLTLAGFITPEPGDGWRIRGRLVAEIVQSCVVTLEPVAARHDAEIERQYVPAEAQRPAREVVLAHDDEDLPDPYTDVIDPAALAVESLSLMIDPYPRAAGATSELARYAASGPAEQEEEPRRPFAGLAVLKGRAGGKRD
jgi:uncharacterized metal-binding protein YceD (DUF177 family)